MGSGTDEERFKQLLVSNGADGLSVNTRRYNGACTWMKTEDERNWLIIMHCSNHRHLVQVSRIKVYSCENFVNFISMVNYIESMLSQRERVCGKIDGV